MPLCITLRVHSVCTQHTPTRSTATIRLNLPYFASSALVGLSLSSSRRFAFFVRCLPKGLLQLALDTGGVFTRALIGGDCGRVVLVGIAAVWFWENVHYLSVHLWSELLPSGLWSRESPEQVRGTQDPVAHGSLAIVCDASDSLF